MQVDSWFSSREHLSTKSEKLNKKRILLKFPNLKKGLRKFSKDIKNKNKKSLLWMMRPDFGTLLLKSWRIAKTFTRWKRKSKNVLPHFLYNVVPFFSHLQKILLKRNIRLLLFRWKNAFDPLTCKIFGWVKTNHCIDDKDYFPQK